MYEKQKKELNSLITNYVNASGKHIKFSRKGKKFIEDTKTAKVERDKAMQDIYDFIDRLVSLENEW